MLIRTGAMEKEKVCCVLQFMPMKALVVVRYSIRILHLPMNFLAIMFMMEKLL